jgi:hypothetical protein
LPYKIYGEEPSDWRSYFHKKYSDSIQIYSKTDSLHDANVLYYHILEKDIDNWFVYNDRPAKPANYPGLNELLNVKSGDCYGWAYLESMILRSFGIPASIDFIPYWGSRNGSHAIAVFWDDSLQGFRTASGRELINPAKVFRYSFKKQNNGWTDSILPVIGKEPFLINFLKHDHWTDVTAEHTKTATVVYPVADQYHFAYLCVYNYGQWIPIYWGKVENRRVSFKNMGIGLLYRVAVPKNNGFEIISPAFQLDSAGEKGFFKSDFNQRETFHLSKLNTGARSWVEKDKDYSLYYTDEKGDWLLFETLKCEQDSVIIFDKVPTNALYRLLEIGGTNRMERPFLYENEKQVWR